MGRPEFNTSNNMEKVGLMCDYQNIYLAQGIQKGIRWFMEFYG